MSEVRSQKSEVRVFLFPVFYFLFFVFIGCQSGGGFQDIALVKQAKGKLRQIRNALEEYKLDYGTYPAEGSDLKVKLAPYLSKLFYFTGEETSEYTRITLGAQNNLNQIRNVLSKCSMIKDPEVKEIFDDIQESLKLHEAVLDGKEEEISSVSTELSKLQKVLDGLKPLELKDLKQDSLVNVASLIIASVETSIPSFQGEALKRLENIKNTFKCYKADLLGKKLNGKKELYSPQGELAALREITDSLSILPLQELIDSYYELKSGIDYCDFLLTIQRDIEERASKLVSMLDAKMPEAKRAAIVVQAEASLRKMADVIRDHRREKGRFPEQGVNLDSILHPYFVETTMSGEQIDRWVDALSWFNSGPLYKTDNPDMGFMLEAQVNNLARTPIFIKVRIENKWDEVISAFSGLPTYKTPDSTQTYFIKARANDTGLTWVTERPPK